MRATSRRFNAPKPIVTCSSEELRVRLSQLPDSEAGFQMLAGTLPWSSVASLIAFGLAGSSGKTFPVSCLRTEDGTLAPSSGRWLPSGMGSPGECWTLSSTECPSVVVESSLSAILETGDVPQRFYLSARACEGILRRAEKRGKTLPERLASALATVAATSMGTAPTSPKSPDASRRRPPESTGSQQPSSRPPSTKRK